MKVYILFKLDDKNDFDELDMTDEEIID